MPMDTLRRFAQEECGVTAIEYAIIGGAVALVLLGALPGLKAPLTAIFESLGSGFDTAGSPSAP